MLLVFNSKVFSHNLKIRFIILEQFALLIEDTEKIQENIVIYKLLRINIKEFQVGNIRNELSVESQV